MILVPLNTPGLKIERKFPAFGYKLGAAGVSDDFPLAAHWANQRTLRLADGPDEVHLAAVAKLELRAYS